MKNSTATILLLISVGLFYTFINPQYQKTKDLRTEAADYKNVLENVSALTETRDQLLTQYENFPKKEEEKLVKVLPDNINSVGLAMDFDSIASKYGATIKNIQVGSTQSDNTTSVIQDNSGLSYEKVKVTFSFVASYDNFRKFMRDVEQSLRIIDIRSVSFDSTDAGLYEYQITIETYWLK